MSWDHLFPDVIEERTSISCSRMLFRVSSTFSSDATAVLSSLRRLATPSSCSPVPTS